MRATLPQAARLRRPAEFAAALKGRRVAYGAFFVISASPLAPMADANAAADAAPPGTPPIARLGLVIAKRYAPLAVTRNALKRVVREAFRAQRQQLPARDYVVRLQAKVPPLSLTSLKRAARAEIDAHLQKASR